MEVAVYNIKGEDTGRKVTLNDEVFARDLSEGNAEHTLYLDIKQYPLPRQPAPGNPQEQRTQRGVLLHPQDGDARKAAAAPAAVTSTLRCSIMVDVCSVPAPRLPLARSLNKKMKSLARKIAFTSLRPTTKQIFVVENPHFRRSPHEELRGARQELQSSMMTRRSSSFSQTWTAMSFSRCATCS